MCLYCAQQIAQGLQPLGFAARISDTTRTIQVYESIQAYESIKTFRGVAFPKLGHVYAAASMSFTADTSPVMPTTHSSKIRTSNAEALTASG